MRVEVRRRWRSGVLAGLLLWVPWGAGLHADLGTAEPANLHLSNESLEVDLDSLRVFGEEGFRADPVETGAGLSGRSEDRVARLVSEAAEDLGRGETTRAMAAIETALRLEPQSPEALWLRSVLDERRGQLAAAEAHLERFLLVVQDRADWRSAAEVRLATLREGRRRSPAILDTQGGEPGEWLGSEMALRDLAAAQAQAALWAGVGPADPVEVVFYGEAAYRNAHRQRFSFDTAGFFDGRIHVKSSPRGGAGLRSLLFHESMHALFRDQTGGDEPYWLNEGMAHRNERQAEGLPVLTRSERSTLHGQILLDRWIPLGSLAADFSGLSNAEARAAYLEAAAAVAFIESRTDPATRARMLGDLGRGVAVDRALSRAVGLDTAELERALQAEIRSEFSP